ncbi:MAG TPA: uroporphyrinogen-III C-methyltransferase [Povalibacter sp.]|nr:uroporphyrinogen-III C-methyltransferase [Povalibacter sp.]
MADYVPDNRSAEDKPATSRRVHSHSRLTTAIAVLALAIAAYGVWRLDATRDRLEQANQQIGRLDSQREVVRSELQTLAEREQVARRELSQRLDALNDAPKQLQEFGAALEELRGRAEGPERAWSRAEAAFLMELAQRRLMLDRDVDTAIVALESADSRLASLRDPGVGEVRQQIAREVQALRLVRRPDVTGILAQLTNAEEQAALAPVRGIVAVERATPAGALPEGFLARAWAVARNAVAALITVRKIDSRGGSVVTIEEQLLRRQHLQLLLFSARAAVVRHDNTAYRSALAGARQWLSEFFDLADPGAAALAKQIAALEPINIDPSLPDVSGSSLALQRLLPTRHTAS